MEKTGRNDPCSCGSGKKFKQCCLLKKGGSGVKRKITAKWINPKADTAQNPLSEGPNLMDRTFGQAMHSTESTFKPIMPKVTLGAIKENNQTEAEKTPEEKK